MARSIDSSFYKTIAWKHTRKNYIQYKQGLCEDCLAKGIYTPATCVHHQIELTEDNRYNPEIAYGYDNLVALCHDCHNIRHNRKRERRYEIGTDGTVEVTG